MDQALVLCPTEKFFDGVAGHVASKVPAAVAHEWVRIFEGMKEISRAVSFSLLYWSK